MNLGATKQKYFNNRLTAELYDNEEEMIARIDTIRQAIEEMRDQAYAEQRFDVLRDVHTAELEFAAQVSIYRHQRDARRLLTASAVPK